MDSLVEYVALYANILVRSKELDELRERLDELRERLEKRKARKRGAGSTETEARQTNSDRDKAPRPFGVLAQ